MLPSRLIDDGRLVFRTRAVLDREWLESFAALLWITVAGQRDFDCLLTTDTELKRLNHRFRGRKTATDVLSFPSASPETAGGLAISVGSARAQAREFGHTVEEEIAILMLHGLLHLLGYDHETDTGRMAEAEAGWRASLQLPAGLIQRASR